MKPTAETPTPDLDIMMLRAGWAVADSPKFQQLRADQMHRTRHAVMTRVARIISKLANWFEQHAHRAVATDQRIT